MSNQVFCGIWNLRLRKSQEVSLFFSKWSLPSTGCEFYLIKFSSKKTLDLWVKKMQWRVSVSECRICFLGVTDIEVYPTKGYNKENTNQNKKTFEFNFFKPGFVKLLFGWHLV